MSPEVLHLQNLDHRGPGQCECMLKALRFREPTAECGCALQAGAVLLTNEQACSVENSERGSCASEKEKIMTKPRIVVTGATGKTGSVVVSELLKAGYLVRAIVHREDGRSARLKSHGAESVAAEMRDVERADAALVDVQMAYYCPPIDPYM